MKETERISRLFNDLYNGGPWLGETLIETLHSITTEEAHKKYSQIAIQFGKL